VTPKETPKKESRSGRYQRQIARLKAQLAEAQLAERASWCVIPLRAGSGAFLKQTEE
jgi:hypothetical protein